MRDAIHRGEGAIDANLKRDARTGYFTWSGVNGPVVRFDAGNGHMSISVFGEEGGALAVPRLAVNPNEVRDFARTLLAMAERAEAA